MTANQLQLNAEQNFLVFPPSIGSEFRRFGTLNTWIANLRSHVLRGNTFFFAATGTVIALDDGIQLQWL